ncbi:MAG: C25 family cysteine peptidase [Verrucomicrobiota bacterium]
MKHLTKLAFPILVLAMATSVVMGATPTSKKTVLFVTQPAEACWQDFAFLAAVPASHMTNHGNGAVIALDETGQIPREVDDYLRRLKPDGVCHLGTKPLTPVPQFGKLLEMPCTSAAEAANLCATNFWNSSNRVVLCREDDYASALMASSLAARLGIPLLFCGEQGLSKKTSEVLQSLHVKEKLFVGKAPADLKVNELPDIRGVLGFLKEQKLATPYLALVNIRDRKSTTVHKISLAAPILAAAHDGMVVPFDADIHWRVPFTGTPIKGDLPKGIPTGSKPPKAGVVDLPEGKVPFVLSFGPSGKEFLLSLDLDGNGSFDGPGEGPLKKNGVFTLLGKPRTIDFGRRYSGNCDLSVTTGTAEDIIAPLRKLYAATGIPRYLCIVGFPDAIPQAILTKEDTDMTSDLPYANADDDLFSEIAVGRIIAENATFATLHASRTVTHDSLLDPSWSSRAGQARWENTMGGNFGNVGLDTSASHDVKDLKWIEPPSEKNKNKGKREQSISQDSPLTRVAFISHMAHSWWKDIGQTYDMNTSVLLAPTVIESGGCMTCNLDYEPGLRSVISRMFRNGALSFCGQTRPGIAQQQQQRIEFWNGIFSGQTIGEAHRRAENSMAALVLETGQTRGGPDHYQLHIRSLFGDPAFKPYLPSPPKSAPAKVEVKGDIVTAHGPATWWKVQMRVPEDWKPWANKPLYVLRGAGTYAHSSWCRDEYDREEIFINAEVTTTRRIKSITQTQKPPAPLGWTGKHTVDENPDGSRTYRWRVRLVDFDQKTGVITNKLDSIDYKIEFQQPAR